MIEKIIAKDRKHLQQILFQEIKKYGHKADLNHIDVSNVKDMSGLFAYTEFNPDISKWDVLNVTDMSFMFFESEFNQDISNWDVSNIETINFMFKNSKFNHDLTNWKPLNLKGKNDSFLNCEAPVPYWYKAYDTHKAVNSYWLNKELEQKLDIKNIVNRKVKI